MEGGSGQGSGTEGRKADEGGMELRDRERESWREREREKKEIYREGTLIWVSPLKEIIRQALLSWSYLFCCCRLFSIIIPVPFILKYPLFSIWHSCCSQTRWFRLSNQERCQKITFPSVCKQHGIYTLRRICWFWWDARARQQLGGTIVGYGPQATHRQTVKAGGSWSQMHLQSGIWSGGTGREWSRGRREELC